MLIQLEITDLLVDFLECSLNHGRFFIPYFVVVIKVIVFVVLKCTICAFDCHHVLSNCRHFTNLSLYVQD